MLSVYEVINTHSSIYQKQKAIFNESYALNKRKYKFDENYTGKITTQKNNLAENCFYQVFLTVPSQFFQILNQTRPTIHDPMMMFVLVTKQTDAVLSKCVNLQSENKNNPFFSNTIYLKLESIEVFFFSDKRKIGVVVSDPDRKMRGLRNLNFFHTFQILGQLAT